MSIDPASIIYTGNAERYFVYIQLNINPKYFVMRLRVEISSVFGCHQSSTSFGGGRVKCVVILVLIKPSQLIGSAHFKRCFPCRSKQNIL